MTEACRTSHIQNENTDRGHPVTGSNFSETPSSSNKVDRCNTLFVLPDPLYFPHQDFFVLLVLFVRDFLGSGLSLSYSPDNT
jgi:hypothetical protein